MTFFRGSKAITDPNYKVSAPFNFVVAAYGSVGNIAETGLGISYYFHYAPDNATKQQTLGDLDDDSFDKTIAFHVKPSYTIGQFTIGLGVQFEIQGVEQNYQRAIVTGDIPAGAAYKKEFDEKAAFTAANMLTDRFELELEPEVSWAPNDGMKFRLYYEHVLLDVANQTALSKINKDKKELGLDVVLKLFVDGAFQDVDTENQNPVINFSFSVF